MNSTIDLIGPIIANAQAANPPEEGDYYDDEGFLVCGKCHTRRECIVKTPVIDRQGEFRELKVRALCECRAKAKEAEGESGQTPFEWLKQFVDEPMKVMESMGIYTVRTKDNRVVLTSAAAESPFYCSAEKLADHIDHEIVCLARYAEAASFDEPGEITGISIWCDECQEVIFSMEKDGAVLAYGEDEASDAPDDYGYDEPEEEE